MNSLVRWWRVRSLESGDFSRRMRAVEKAVVRHDRAMVGPLIEGLEDEDPDVRSSVAEALGRMADPRAAAALVNRVLVERERKPLDRAVAALQQIGPEESLKLLLAALNREDLYERRAAASTIRKIAWELLDQPERARVAIVLEDLEEAARQGRPAMNSLRAVLREGTPRAVRDAADALGRSGSPEAIEILVDLLCDPLQDTDRRQIAAWSLKRFAWDNLGPQLIAYLAVVCEQWGEAAAIGEPAVEALGQALECAQPTARREAARALGKIGGNGPAERLANAATDPQQDVLVREEAARSLGKVQANELAVPALYRALDDPVWTVRLAAANALDHLRVTPTNDGERAARAVAQKDWARAAACGEHAVEPLVSALHFFSVSSAAARTLAKLGDQGVERLVGVLRATEVDPAVREVVATALAEIGDPRAIEPMLAMLKDRDMSVRQSAVWMLERLGWQPADDAQRATVAIAHEEWETLLRLGTAAVEPLLRLAECGVAEEPAYATLHELLKSKPGRLSIAHLREIVALPDAPATGREGGGNWTATAQAPESAPHQVKVRQLAKYELIRRGIIV